MDKEPLSVMVHSRKEYTDKFIALVNQYESLGEKIISDGYVLQKGKVGATKTVDEHNDFAIKQHDKQFQKFLESVNQDVNEQHERFLSSCNQFTGVNQMMLYQARKLEEAGHTNAVGTKATKAASGSTRNAQLRDRVGESSKGGMQHDNRLKTIMEDNMSEQPHTNERVENVPAHKKRHWNTKWLHPAKFLLNFIKKKKPE